MSPRMRARLTLACGDYDLNDALADGRVQPQGVRLTVLRLPSPERHARMALHREFDVCELSMATYLAMVGTGDRSLIAIPAFPHRRFRHGYLFVRSDGGIDAAEQLSGARIGLRTWETTAGVWVRGILQDDHGVDLRSIDWVTQDDEDVPLRHANAYRIGRAAPGASVSEMLRAGELEAIIYPEASVVGGSVRRLFEDPKAAEIAYHRRTGIFPIMHTVVVRRELVDEMPWLPRELLEAFRRSKELAFRAMRDPRRVSLAWLSEALLEQEQILGDDPWAYDFAGNAHVLDTLVRYAHEQGLLPEPIPASALFAPSTLDPLPTYR